MNCEKTIINAEFHTRYIYFSEQSCPASREGGPPDWGHDFGQGHSLLPRIFPNEGLSGEPSATNTPSHWPKERLSPERGTQTVHTASTAMFKIKMLK